MAQIGETNRKNAMQDLTAIQERFDALAADALENLIQEVETKNHVKVTDLEVVLVPEQASDPGCPAVEVNLTVEAINPQRRVFPADGAS